MSAINTPNPAPGLLPPDYQEALYWSITGKPIRLIMLNIVGVFLFVIFGVVFFGLAISLGKLPAEISLYFGLVEIGSLVAGILLTLGLHELTHGWVMQLFGARPTYGILWKQMIFYATSPGFAYRRLNYVVIALAPFVALSLLVVLGMWVLQGTAWVALLAICGIVNASGAVGDLWMSVIVLRFATTAYVVDERDGLRVFLPQA